MTEAVLEAIYGTAASDLCAAIQIVPQFTVPAPSSPRPNLDVALARVFWLPWGSLAGALLLQLVVAATRVGEIRYGHAFWTTFLAGLAAVLVSSLLIFVSGPGRPPVAIQVVAAFAGFCAAAMIIGRMVKRREGVMCVGFLWGACIAVFQILLSVAVLLMVSAGIELLKR